MRAWAMKAMASSKDDISHLPTKDELYTKIDEGVGKLGLVMDRPAGSYLTLAASDSPVAIYTDGNTVAHYRRGLITASSSWRGQF
jgi:hypothetical protein